MMTTRSGARPSMTRAAAAAALALALASPAALAKDKYETLSAGIQIAEQIGAPNPDCAGSGGVLTGYIEGNGLATTIGAFTLTSTDCIMSATGLPPFAFSSTDFTLTAAGGTIRATYSGTATPVSALTPWLLALNGTVTFTSGTGAYRKVKGGGSRL
jgi:hypothetical protein